MAASERLGGHGRRLRGDMRQFLAALSSHLLKVLRRLAQLPVFRQLVHVRLLTRLSFALRASIVEDRLRFAWAELASDAVLTHRLRESNVVVTVRHGTGDILILDEIFFQHEYELPAEVERALRVVDRPKVIDVGANTGLFGAWLLTEFPLAEIVSVEPSPENLDILEQTVEHNRANADWRVVRAAVGTARGTATFSLAGTATSHLAREGETGSSVDVVDFFELARSADLVKLDIEGGEWPILADPRLASLAAALVLEFHADGCPDRDPKQAAMRALERAGFTVRANAERPRLGTGVLWAWRPHDRLPVRT
jgi:FkbM family methyltransferase